MVVRQPHAQPEVRPARGLCAAFDQRDEGAVGQPCVALQCRHAEAEAGEHRLGIDTKFLQDRRDDRERPDALQRLRRR